MCHHKQTAGGNVNVEGANFEDSEGIEGHGFGNRRKRILCSLESESLAELCRGIIWKAELLSNECGYFTEEISKQSVEGSAWSLLNALGRHKREETD